MILIGSSAAAIIFQSPQLGGTLCTPSLRPQASCHLSAQSTTGKGGIKRPLGPEGALAREQEGLPL